MKILYISLAFCFIVLNCFASTDSLKTDSTKTSLTLATIYSSNANYYGQTTEAKLPYVLTNATMRLKSGFSVSASAYKILNIGSGISAVDLGAAYSFNMTKKLSGSLGYSRSFYPENSPLIQSVSRNTASGSLSYDWTWFNSALNADYAFGGGNNFMFVTLGNSKFIDLGSLFSDKDYLSLEPAIEIVGGTNLNEGETINNDQPSENGNNSNNSLIGNLFPKPKKDAQPSPSPTITTPFSTFDLLSYNFKLPLAYNRTHYTVETSYQLSVLSKKLAGDSNNLRSFFNLSFYYMF